ncbi:glycosyltransferase family 2 protein [Flavihalobacter algicola]|uniref:Glycosyltransferase family 2 protein n=2 Tax=Psychroserpens algicola TaxID=1719034 RepID=A0ABT0HC85_9FLAO|nr:glycosyltransferase family 2 protein [Psychroserpens algicola]
MFAKNGIFETMNKLDVSVIISTYNQPIWLRNVLWSYEQQVFKNFEIIIADDGSSDETKAVIDDFILNSNLKITHVWQEDNGFQKTKILNKAILKSNAEYLIFTDGDCIVRQDFVDTHIKMRRPNTCLSGGYFKLTKAISEAITKLDIEQQNCFNKEWLLQRGCPKTFKLNKLTSFGLKAWFLNTFTPTKATFDGMNTSVWKKDILAVNGFDERMQYGGEDRELGERLLNNGVRFVQARYSVICVHLYHERPYKNEDAIARNKSIRKLTKRNKSTFTDFGIEQ